MWLADSHGFQYMYSNTGRGIDIILSFYIQKECIHSLIPSRGEKIYTWYHFKRKAFSAFQKIETEGSLFDFYFSWKFSSARKCL
jgi:predicted DNA-binding helix-hairpin-helix protein